MDLKHLPIIDWEAGTKLAGNNRDLAEDMLSMLTSDLLEVIDRIKQLHIQQDYQNLLQQTHKFHGAVRYCGLPRLKIILDLLETDLKNNIMEHLSSLIQQLDIEITLLLEQRQPSLSN